MFCSKCGKDLSAGTQFCPKCGAAVNSPDKKLDPANLPAPKTSVKEMKSAMAVKERPPEKYGRKALLLVAALAAVLIAAAVYTYQKEYSAWIPAIAKESYIPTDVDLDVANQIAAPTNCRAVPSETEQGKVILSWDPVPEATVYNACAYTDATYTTIMEGASAEIPAVKGTSIRFTKAAAGKTYYLGVRAGKNINGKMVYSDWVNLSYTHPEATAP